MSARAFFEALPGRVNGKEPSGLDASYVFVIDGGGTWTVKVADGKVAVAEGDQGGDCRISTSEEVFDRIVAGSQNPLTAYMTGKIKVAGDVAAAMRLKDILS